MLKPCLVFPSLNPFENQVYFYTSIACVFCDASSMGLNPFENQVYFYHPPIRGNLIQCFLRVLIPLRIRSISTDGELGGEREKFEES